ncbi:MAG: Tol-Pal system protein TolB [Chlamydiota bacterium]
MQHKSLFLFILSFITCALFASEAPQEIRIQLLTESSLSSIYLSEIVPTGSAFSSSYLQELEKVLRHDFHYNGKTSVQDKTVEKENRIKSGSLSSIQAPYVISFSIKEKNLQAKVFDVKSNSAKSFSDISLTGTLSEDRRKLHGLSDSIYKSLFHAEGVASSRILYSFQKKDSSGQLISEIAECDWDGENIHTLTHENNYCINPVVIPKGEKFHKDLFLYVSYKTGQPKIFITSKEDGKGKKAVDIRGNQMLPAISKQRDKLAFVCDASGRTDLFIQSIQPDTGQIGTPKQIFSYPRSSQGSPTFNPDGSKIAFVSDKDGAPRIYQISSESKSTRQPTHLITKKNKENTCPSWSPDGIKLAYSAKTEGVRQIWIYDFVSGEEKQLTYGLGNKENPCWAPNSLHIVFNSTDDNYSDLYVVNLHQPNAIKITKGPGKKHYPAWGSR